MKTSVKNLEWKFDMPHKISKYRHGASQNIGLQFLSETNNTGA